MEWFGLEGTSGTVGIPGKEQRRGLGGEGQARANGDGENDRLFGLEALLKPLPWAGDLPGSPRAPARPGPPLPGLRLPLCKTPAPASAPPGGNCSTGSAGVTERWWRRGSSCPRGRVRGHLRGFPASVISHPIHYTKNGLVFLYFHHVLSETKGGSRKAPLERMCFPQRASGLEKNNLETFEEMQ